MDKKIIAIISIIAGLLIILGVLGYFFVAPQSAIGSGNYVEIQAKGFYECSPASTPSLIQTSNKNIGSQGSGFIKCIEDGTTDQCDFKIELPADKLVSLTQFLSIGKRTRVVYQICDLEKDTCQPQQIVEQDITSGQTKIVNTDPVRYGSSIFIDVQGKNTFGSWKNVQGGEYSIIYKPFIIWKETLQGGRVAYSSVLDGCDFKSEGEDRLLFSLINLGLPSDDKDEVVGDELTPYQTWNFVELTLPIATENADFVRGGYCRNGNIYEIGEVLTESGRYKVVDFDKVIDNSPECCPSFKEPNKFCNNNLEIELRTETSQEECSLFQPCANSEFEAFGSKTLRKFECVEGTCQQVLKEVECTTSTDCDAGFGCDILNFECVDLDIGEEEGVFINGTFQPTLDCGFFKEYKSVTKTNLFGKERVINKCVISGWVWLVSVLLLLIIFFVGIMLKFRRR